MANLNSDASSKMKFLQDKIEALNKEISDLKLDIHVKEGHLKDEQEKNQQLNTEIKSLRKEIEKLNKEINDLMSNSKTSLSQFNDALKSKEEELLSKFKKEKSILESKIEKLIKEVKRRYKCL